MGKAGKKRGKRSGLVIPGEIRCFAFGCGVTHPKRKPNARDGVMFQPSSSASAEIKKKWETVVPSRRKPYNCVQNYVCQLHFEPKYLVQQDSDGVPLTLQNWKLQPDAVPSIFDRRLLNKSLAKKQVRKAAQKRRDERKRCQKLGIPVPAWAATQQDSHSSTGNVLGLDYSDDSDHDTEDYDNAEELKEAESMDDSDSEDDSENEVDDTKTEDFIKTEENEVEELCDDNKWNNTAKFPVVAQNPAFGKRTHDGKSLNLEQYGNQALLSGIVASAYPAVITRRPVEMTPTAAPTTPTSPTKRMRASDWMNDVNTMNSTDSTTTATSTSATTASMSSNVDDFERNSTDSDRKYFSPGAKYGRYFDYNVMKLRSKSQLAGTSNNNEMQSVEKSATSKVAEHSNIPNINRTPAVGTVRPMLMTAHGPSRPPVRPVISTPPAPAATITKPTQQPIQTVFGISQYYSCPGTKNNISPATSITPSNSNFSGTGYEYLTTNYNQPPVKTEYHPPPPPPRPYEQPPPPPPQPYPQPPPPPPQPYQQPPPPPPQPYQQPVPLPPYPRPLISQPPPLYGNKNEWPLRPNPEKVNIYSDNRPPQPRHQFAPQNDFGNRGPRPSFGAGPMNVNSYQQPYPQNQQQIFHHPKRFPLPPSPPTAPRFQNSTQLYSNNNFNSNNGNPNMHPRVVDRGNDGFRIKIDNPNYRRSRRGR